MGWERSALNPREGGAGSCLPMELVMSASSFFGGDLEGNARKFKPLAIVGTAEHSPGLSSST